MKETAVQVLSEKHRKNIKRVMIINAAILISIILKPYSVMPAVMVGVLILFYLIMTAFMNPIKAFFIIFGIKLTFDAFWNIQIPLSTFELGLLDIIFIPFLILMLVGPTIQRQTPRWPLYLTFFYLLWSILATMVNGYYPDIALIIRQSGIFFGLLFGLKYIRNQESFNDLIYFIFISTLVPLFASLLQIGLNAFGITILYYKLEKVRELRLSGLYFDSATTGMVIITSLISNIYLLHIGFIRKKYRKYCLFLIPLSFFIILAGGTRSMIGVALFVIVLYIVKNLKKTLILVPLLLIITFFGRTYINEVTLKTSKEINREIKITEILQESEYRTMFTGRVSIWQDIWNEVKNSTTLQKLFGTGKSSNAHSSYFFLLLQIGWMGMIYYIFINIALIVKLSSSKTADILKTSTLLALFSLLLIGTSATTACYTSFQWIVYQIVGGVLAIGTIDNKMESDVGPIRIRY